MRPHLKSFYILPVFVTLLALVLGSCKKIVVDHTPACCTAGPPTALFEVVDQDGNGLLLSLRDSVKLSYADNGSTWSFLEPVVKLDSASVDTASYKKFNGLILQDKYTMALLSTRPGGPIHVFNLRVNGHDLGELYFDYNDYKNSLTQASTTAFALQNVPAKNIMLEGGKFYLSVLQEK